MVSTARSKHFHLSLFSEGFDPKKDIYAQESTGKIFALLHLALIGISQLILIDM